MNRAFATAIVAGRLGVVVGWIALAAVMAVRGPSLSDAQGGALGQLIPADSRALAAEELSLELFAFPLASRTVIVQRDPRGLSAGRVAVTARAIRDVNRYTIPNLHAEGAYGSTNAVALAAPVVDGMMLMAAERPPFQSFLDGPSTVVWVAV